MPASFATEPASDAQRSLTFFSAAAVTVGALVSIAVGDQPLAQFSSFLPAIATATSLFYLMASYIFMAQFRLLRCVPFAVLSAGFLYAGLAAFAQALTAPGTLSATGLGGGAGTSAWFWLFWHAGVAVMLLVFAASETWLNSAKVDDRWEFAARIGIATLIPLVTILVSYAALRAPEFLPKLAARQSYDLLSRSVFGKLLLGTDIAALTAILLATRCKTVVQLAVAVVTLTETLGVVLLLSGTARYTSGWYLGRLYAAISAGFVPVLFMLEMPSLYARIIALNASLENIALLDGLTGLANRRHLNQRLAAEWSGGTRRRASLAMLMIDVDHFKHYNDTQGHLAGDEALRQVGHVINAGIKRSNDFAARYGGEEFAVILPDTDIAAACQIAESIRQAVATYAIPRHEGSDGDVLTISVGAAAIMPRPDVPPATLIEAADRALYTAKEQGRNRVASATSQPSLKLLPAAEVIADRFRPRGV